MKHAWRFVGHLLLWAVLACPALSAGAADPVSAAQAAQADVPSGERERLTRERAALQDKLATREQACRRDFWVNSCLRQAQAEHRQASGEIDKQQTRLEQQARQRRADEVSERVKDRQQEIEQRPTLSDEEAAAAQRARLERVQQTQAQRQEQAHERRLRQEQRQQQAAERLQRREQAAQAAQAAQATRLERNAQRNAERGQSAGEAPP